MQTAQAIARLVGPVLAVVGIGMLTNEPIYLAMAREFLASNPFIYLSGILALVAGLAILNVHSRWTADWRSLVTALGWMLSLAGTLRILGPQLVSFAGAGVLAHNYFLTGTGIVLLGLGGFLTLKGYAA